MFKKVIGGLVVAGLIFLLPLVGNSVRLSHPAPWIGFLAGFITYTTQPSLGIRKMFSDARDRLSALGIFCGVVGAQLGASLDFANRPVIIPAPFSGFVLAGLLVCAGGLALRIWAIRTLGNYFTPTVAVRNNQRVISTGPHRYLRHPSYTGTILTCLGVALALGSTIGLVLVLLLVVPAYLYRIGVEEKTLLAGLGESYRMYISRTWALVPRVMRRAM